MRVTEVTPFGKSDDGMEAGVGEGRRQKCRDRAGEAHREKSLRGMFIPSYRLSVICIPDLSKSRRQLRTDSHDLFATAPVTE